MDRTIICFKKDIQVIRIAPILKVSFVSNNKTKVFHILPVIQEKM